MIAITDLWAGYGGLDIMPGVELRGERQPGHHPATSRGDPARGRPPGPTAPRSLRRAHRAPERAHGRIPDPPPAPASGASLRRARRALRSAGTAARGPGGSALRRAAT